jgi:hypothetical protein
MQEANTNHRDTNKRHVAARHFNGASRARSLQLLNINLTLHIRFAFQQAIFAAFIGYL